VNWGGILSDLIKVKYGVRQGSILGPILFIVLVGDMAVSLGIGNEDNVVYADDSNNVWQTGSTVSEVVIKLTEKSLWFAHYTRRLGLAMNASKTQLLFSTNAGNMADVAVMVDRNVINPSDTIELTTAPHAKAMLTAARQHASVIARLAIPSPGGVGNRARCGKVLALAVGGCRPEAAPGPKGGGKSHNPLLKHPGGV
jgi:hypothetical protein